MTKRTCNIIRACKGRLYSDINGELNRVKAYMSEACDYPIEDYTDEQMEQIVLEAMCDYVDTCDKPSYFLRLVSNAGLGRNLTFTEKACIAFALVNVKDDNGYINGFTAEMFEFDQEKEVNK